MPAAWQTRSLRTLCSRSAQRCGARRRSAADSPKRYHNLFGVTLGTGFGGGIVRNGELFIGDNSMAGEVWLLRNKLKPEMNAEEGACIRAVRRVYGEKANIPFDQVPEPKVLFDIAMGKTQGDQAAALAAFARLGEVAGDAMGNALTLLDGLSVVGGGVSGAWPLFLPRLVEELNSDYTGPGGNRFRRLASKVFNLEDATQLDAFLKGDQKTVKVPGSNLMVLPRQTCRSSPRDGRCTSSPTGAPPRIAPKRKLVPPASSVRTTRESV